MTALNITHAWVGKERGWCVCVAWVGKGGVFVCVWGGSSGEEERGYDIINFCLFIIKTFFPF